MRPIRSFNLHYEDGFEVTGLSLRQRLIEMNWGLLLIPLVLLLIGVVSLYSAAQGSWTPWALNHLIRFGLGLVIMVLVAMVDVRFWMRSAYIWFAIGIVLLILVEFVGTRGGGAQRWLDLYVFNLQPSELMKVFLILALARYLHERTYEQMGYLVFLVLPLVMLVLPFGLIFIQPDLGTGLLLFILGCIMLYAGGLRHWKVLAGLLSALLAFWAAWEYLLKDYQKARLITFRQPEADPFGDGYQIIQSKIAMGSGGLFGKGFLNGTQSQLQFLPEKQTDFIFALISEEWGLFGAFFVLAIYGLLFAYLLILSTRIPNQFGRLVVLGVATNLFLYVTVNVGMVSGSLPVVGVPLPLISYGGTIMLTTMLSLGLVMSVYINRHVAIGRFTIEAERGRFYDGT